MVYQEISLTTLPPPHPSPHAKFRKLQKRSFDSCFMGVYDEFYKTSLKEVFILFDGYRFDVFIDEIGQNASCEVYFSYLCFMKEPPRPNESLFWKAFMKNTTRWHIISKNNPIHFSPTWFES